MLRIGFIGDGGISRATRAALGPGFETCAVLDRSERVTDGVGVVGSLADLIATRPDVVVECAGHQAVHDHAEMILLAGIPLVVVSIGSLADPALEQRLRDAAGRGRTRMIFPAGAIGGMDALAAARLGGLTTVRYRACKPALAWRGTPAEETLALNDLTAATSFFHGSAREAALRFPKNSNVAATVALNGIGFDATEVELVADPNSTRNIHEIIFEGRDGACRFEIEGNPSPENPKTSMLTAHSVARSLIDFDASRRPL